MIVYLHTFWSLHTFHENVMVLQIICVRFTGWLIKRFQLITFPILCDAPSRFWASLLISKSFLWPSFISWLMSSDISIFANNDSYWWDLLKCSSSFCNICCTNVPAALVQQMLPPPYLAVTFMFSGLQAFPVFLQMKHCPLHFSPSFTRPQDTSQTCV